MRPPARCVPRPPMWRNGSLRCRKSAAGWGRRSGIRGGKWRPGERATGGSSAAVEQVNGIPLSARDMGETPARDLKGLAEAIGKQMGSGVVALVSSAEGKASIVVGVSPDLLGRVNAVDLVRKAAVAVGGKA